MPDTSITSWKLLYETGRQALQSRKLQEAEQSFSAALQLAEDFEPGDPRLAATLNALARIYSLQRRYLAAAALLNRLLEVTERTLGQSHVQVAGVLTNLAEMYTHLGAAREELELRERVLAIRRDDPNADATSLQRLEERVTELRAVIEAQDATEEAMDEELEQLPVVRTAEYSAPITMVDERVPLEPREARTPQAAIIESDAVHGLASALAPASVQSFLSLPPVQRVTPPVTRTLGAAADHGFADMGRDELRLSTARRLGAKSSFMSIVAGIVLVAGLLAARNYMATSDDGRESAGSVNLTNVAAVQATAPAAAPLPPTSRTAEQMVAERRGEAQQELPEAEPYRASKRSAGRERTGDLPVKAPSDAAIQRALRSVEGAVKAIDQRTRAATDSATAIRVQAPTFSKVRMSDAVGSRPPDR